MLRVMIQVAGTDKTVDGNMDIVVRKQRKQTTARKCHCSLEKAGYHAQLMLRETN